jgi:hypothetical protein
MNEINGESHKYLTVPVRVPDDTASGLFSRVFAPRAGAGRGERRELADVVLGMALPSCSGGARPLSKRTS